MPGAAQNAGSARKKIRGYLWPHNLGFSTELSLQALCRLVRATRARATGVRATRARTTGGWCGPQGPGLPECGPQGPGLPEAVGFAAIGFIPRSRFGDYDEW